ncbi:hypothetical protein GBAR_LOCUS24766 [Geodia barretti]|uniref:Uncharacterized protein n=1 Tax=Geodia barretti TaxID=519541 RepID=A0AA35TB03_GEOBA|nr:hypothetical protein GBAR_LOCUS24766 [Geodia barretti]
MRYIGTPSGVFVLAPATTTFDWSWGHSYSFRFQSLYLEVLHDTSSCLGVYPLALRHSPGVRGTPAPHPCQQYEQWQRYSPHDVDRHLTDDIYQRSMYLLHTGNYFNVVGSIRKN